MGSDPHGLDVSDLPTGAPPAVPLVTEGDQAAARTAEADVRWTPDGVLVVAGDQTFGPYRAPRGWPSTPPARRSPGRRTKAT